MSVIGLFLFMILLLVSESRESDAFSMLVPDSQSVHQDGQMKARLHECRKGLTLAFVPWATFNRNWFTLETGSVLKPS